ncbi:unnamed protein product [Pleuronectes platessa]|uniref:Uncharacterized protein n=1 Tax=Pleuronectes platessa TaxID=8262 RepID=A0A9N7U4N9_PLEPL|nr:unnamed protein product [Pleuronectes platessa]
MEGFFHQSVGTCQDPARILQNSFFMSHQISHLIDLLAKENANLRTEYHWRIQLSKDLEEHKQELFRQKKLKQMFFNRGRKTKQELEQLQKYSNAEALSATKIASQVNNTIKRKKIKDLQKDYEELKVTYIINQEKSNTEFQEEKIKKNVLQEELDKLKTSHHEVCQSHITNQEKLKTELTQEKKKKKNDFQEELEKLEASFQDVCQSHTINQEEFNSDLQEEKRTKNSLQEELENLEASCHEVCQSPATNQEKFNTELQEEKRKKNDFQEELEKLKASYQEVCQSHATSQEKFISELREEKKKKNVLLKYLEKFRVTSDEVFQRYKPYDYRTELNEDEVVSNVLPDPRCTHARVMEAQFRPVHAPPVWFSWFSR